MKKGRYIRRRWLFKKAIYGPQWRRQVCAPPLDINHQTYMAWFLSHGLPTSEQQIEDVRRIRAAVAARG